MNKEDLIQNGGNHKGSDFMNIPFIAPNLTHLSRKKLSLHTPEGRTMIIFFAQQPLSQ